MMKRWVSHKIYMSHSHQSWNLMEITKLWRISLKALNKGRGIFEFSISPAHTYPQREYRNIEFEGLIQKNSKKLGTGPMRPLLKRNIAKSKHNFLQEIANHSLIPVIRRYYPHTRQNSVHPFRLFWVACSRVGDVASLHQKELGFVSLGKALYV